MTKKIFAIEPAIDLNNRPGFLLDWELTYFCNLDCSYCGDHDNSTQHPPLDRCLKTIDFMFRYVDLYMQQKRRWERIVVLNLYGGESLLHPNIIEILDEVKKQYESKYRDRWNLAMTCTTNGTIGDNLMSRVKDYFSSITVSYHTEGNDKQRAQCRKNIKMLHHDGKRVQVNVMMHKEAAKWQDALDLIEELKIDKIRYIPYVVGDSNHQLVDPDPNSRYYKHTHTYNEKQVTWFKDHWKGMARPHKKDAIAEELDRKELVQAPDGNYVVRSMGRMCCGGKELCVNDDHKDRTYYITDSDFEGWHCSVNWYFLFIRQYQEGIYHHKMCRATFGGKRDKLGFLDDAETILADLAHKLETKTMPVIVCPNTYCGCGFCAPKAENIDTFKEIMKKHNIDDVWKT